MSICTTIRWGRQAPIELVLDDDMVVESDADGDAPPPVDNVVAEVVSALSSPLDFPPFAKATVEGDQVAVALGTGLLRLDEVAAGILTGLREAGVELANVTLVVATADDRRVVATPAEEHGAAVTLHDPADENQLCYVGEMQGDVSLRLNRPLCEADIVLPVACGRLSTGDRSVFDGLFPLFADVESQQRYATHQAQVASDLVRRQDEAGWLLGAPLVMQVVPGRGGTVAAVLLGTPPTCRAESRRIADAIWQRSFPRPARLVVAAVADATPASWRQLADTLAMADTLRSSGGAIALCMELPDRLGKSLRRLRGTTDVGRIARQLARDHDDDTAAAHVLVDVLERGPIYLLSNLEDELIEDLGMAPIADGAELTRLARRMSDCIIIDDAQHTLATISDAAVVPGDLE